MDWIRRLVWPTTLFCAVGTTALGSILSESSDQPLFFTAFPSGSGWSFSTSSLLDHLGLSDLAEQRPHDAFWLLEQSSGELQADPHRLLALAELASQISQNSPPKVAVRWARDAAVYSTFYLAKLPDGPNDDPSRCLALAIHNLALERCLRLAQTDMTPAQSAWPAQLRKRGWF